MFGLLHADPVHTPFAVVLGVYLGWLTEVTGSVRGAVAGHLVNNVLSVWAALGSSFGPLLLWILFRGPVRSGTAIVTMAVGFGTTMIGFILNKTGAWNWQGFETKFLPFLASSLVLVLMARRANPGAATLDRSTAGGRSLGGSDVSD